MTIEFGVSDSSYQAAGELAGIRKLVDDFYTEMDRRPQAKNIRAMHPEDLLNAREKLSYFLSGWLGGPRLYKEKYGPIAIPLYHRKFPIGTAERDAWILCMDNAISRQPYSNEFKQYLKVQLRIPAERITQANAKS